MSKNELLSQLATERQADLFASRVHPLPCLSCGGVVNILPAADIELSAGFACENCGEVLYFAGSNDAGKHLKGWLKPGEVEAARRVNPLPDYFGSDEPF